MANSIRTKVGYNTAKRRALEALARAPDLWWTVKEWAREAEIAPTRRMYTYALRLARYDLVLRASLDGHCVYRITTKGHELARLRRARC
jgi:hypothetical protein